MATPDKNGVMNQASMRPPEFTGGNRVCAVKAEIGPVALQ